VPVAPNTGAAIKHSYVTYPQTACNDYCMTTVRT